MERSTRSAGRGPGVFPWFQQIAVNTVIDHARHAGNVAGAWKTASSAVQDTEPVHQRGRQGSSSGPGRAPRAPRSGAAMATLNDRYRLAITSRLVEERAREVRRGDGRDPGQLRRHPPQGTRGQKAYPMTTPTPTGTRRPAPTGRARGARADALDRPVAPAITTPETTDPSPSPAVRATAHPDDASARAAADRAVRRALQASATRVASPAGAPPASASPLPRPPSSPPALAGAHPPRARTDSPAEPSVRRARRTGAGSAPSSPLRPRPPRLRRPPRGAR